MPKLGGSFRGINTVMRNLNREINRLGVATQAGITTAALHVKGEVLEETPRDEGNLRNSCFVISGDGSADIGGDFKGDNAAKVSKSHNVAIGNSGSRVSAEKMPVAEIGFGAYYAPYVHEIDKNYTVGGWKFLERVLLNERSAILRIIADRARIRR